MIPGGQIPFTSGEQADLVAYLVDELDEALSEHQEREQRLNEWDRAYVGDPKQLRRTFPWPGAANVEIPIIGIHVDSIVARVVNTVMTYDPFWSIRPLHKDVEKYARPLEQYMEWSRKSEFNLYKSVRTNVIELIKYGWSWYKPCWELYRNPSYKVIEGVPMLIDEVINRPNVYHVLNRDVITQVGVEDETQAEWVCHRVRLTNNQMQQRIRDGIYQVDLQKAKDSKEDLTEFHDAMRSARTDSMSRDEKFHTLYEFWIDWSYKGVIVPCVATYHRQLKKLVRGVFNPYGFRALRKSKFIEREGRMEGIGVARRLYQMQEEISTVHRQQLDNSTLANTRFFLGRKGAIRPGTQIWPGRVLPVADPKSDLVPYQLGDIYQSQGVLEMRALSYAERASGVSDYQLGRESSVAGSGATATSTLALIQEGNRRFDLNIRDARDVLGQIGRDIILLNQMYRSSGIAYFVQGQDGLLTDEILKLPPEFAAAKMAVELTASTATVNKEVEKQGLMALMGIVDGYNQKLIQAAGILANPQVPGEMKEAVMKAAISEKYLMDKIMQSFDIKAIDTVVPTLGPTNGNGSAGPTGATPMDPAATSAEPGMASGQEPLGQPTPTGALGP